MRAAARYDGLDLVQVTSPQEFPARQRAALIDCWVMVTNAGGGAGFPFPPVDTHQVAPMADAILCGLHPLQSRLLLALREGTLAGWVVLKRDPNPLVAHWGSVHHLQILPDFRDGGVGSALMHELRRIARDEMGLEQLRLAARGGIGLERFYARLGWREVGRWPEALRLAPGDTRDEILMVLKPL